MYFFRKYGNTFLGNMSYVFLGNMSYTFLGNMSYTFLGNMPYTFLGNMSLQEVSAGASAAVLDTNSNIKEGMYFGNYPSC